MKINFQTISTTYDDALVNVSYTITITRVLIAAAIGGFILFESTAAKTIAVIGILAIMVADYFDGDIFDLADARNDKSKRIKRRKADSIADRAVIQLVSLPLLFMEPAFLWLYVAILVREVVISGYNYHLYRQKIIVYPTAIAKVACFFVGLTVISYLTLSSINTGLITMLMLVLSAFALHEYWRRTPEFGRHKKLEDEMHEVF